MQFEKLKKKWAEDDKKRKAAASRLKKLLLTHGIPLFKRYGIRKAVIFGSISAGRCHPGSDIDILVHPLSGEQYWNFHRDLEDATDASVDLYTMEDDSILVTKILSRGETIYEI